MRKIGDYKNIFLDRDGIINEVVIRDSVVMSPWLFNEFIIRKDFRKFFEKNKTKNFFVVTNQPDLSRKNIKYSELKKMHDSLIKEFKFTEIAFCPHDNHHNCICRKPKPGMILELIFKHKLKKSESVIIGDSNKDILSGVSAGIDTLFLETDYNSMHTNSTIDESQIIKSLSIL